MKVTANFIKAAKNYMAKNGDATLVVSRTQNWNVQALLRIGKLSELINEQIGTEYKGEGKDGTFRKMESTEIKYQSLMKWK